MEVEVNGEVLVEVEVNGEVLVEVEKMNNSIRFTLCSCLSAMSYVIRTARLTVHRNDT